jgi:hypothetical protein
MFGIASLNVLVLDEIVYAAGVPAPTVICASCAVEVFCIVPSDPSPVTENAAPAPVAVDDS